jgi:flagellar hook protein FlgE
MGILGALSTAVSGLAAQSYALENISGNIANASTTGFKRVDTSFVNLVGDQPVTQQLSGSVAAGSSLSTGIQGTLSSTGVATNVAISGDGFFVVAQNTGSTQTPTFAASSLYTRRGDFTQDASGYLVNGAGYFMSGTTYDPTTGAAVGVSPSPIQISKATLAAQVTSTVDYSGNLPSLPQPTNYTGTAGTELLANPQATYTGTASAGFVASSISGGQVTVYSPSGTAANLQLRWAKTDSTTSTAPGSTQTDTWSLYYQNAASPSSWTQVGDPVTFSATGTMTSPTTGAMTLDNVAIGGVTVGNVNMNLTGGLTEYGDSSGAASVALDQDGYTSGSLTDIAIGTDGTITGSYSNGQSKKLAELAIAKFSASDALKGENGGAYSATIKSGDPILTMSGTSLSGASLEASNTDISSEFSKMIVTQQAYSANTKVMSTAQSMLQDIINVIR